MLKITNIRDLVNVSKLPPSRDMRRAFLEEGIKRAKKLGMAVHKDGRCYIPEALRGRGVGYNGKRKANRSDRKA